MNQYINRDVKAKAIDIALFQTFTTVSCFLIIKTYLINLIFPVMTITAEANIPNPVNTPNVDSK